MHLKQKYLRVKPLSANWAKPHGKCVEEETEIEDSSTLPQDMANPNALHPLERLHPSLLDIANEVVELGRYEKQDPYDTAGDITKKKLVDVPDFDCRIDPQVFLN